VASGSGSIGSGGAGSRIVPGGNGVSVGGTNTPGMIALISRTRVASVGVRVGVEVVVAVGVAVAVSVAVSVGGFVGAGVRAWA
jgi:hypothetical protein